MKTNSEALKILASEAGESVTALAEAAIFDGVCEGVCMNDNCTFTTSVEPDCSDGYCEICDTNTVKSVLVLSGMI